MLSKQAWLRAGLARCNDLTPGPKRANAIPELNRLAGFTQLPYCV